jgi:hypothetical protein
VHPVVATDYFLGSSGIYTLGTCARVPFAEQLHHFEVTKLHLITFTCSCFTYFPCRLPPPLPGHELVGYCVNLKNHGVVSIKLLELRSEAMDKPSDQELYGVKYRVPPSIKVDTQVDTQQPTQRRREQTLPPVSILNRFNKEAVQSQQQDHFIMQVRMFAVHLFEQWITASGSFPKQESRPNCL